MVAVAIISWCCYEQKKVDKKSKIFTASLHAARYRSYVERGDVFIAKCLRLAQIKLLILFKFLLVSMQWTVLYP